MKNQTDALRKVVHAYFCRRSKPQQTNQRQLIRKKTISRLFQEVRVILDVDDEDP